MIIRKLLFHPMLVLLLWGPEMVWADDEPFLAPELIFPVPPHLADPPVLDEPSQRAVPPPAIATCTSICTSACRTKSTWPGNGRHAPHHSGYIDPYAAARRSGCNIHPEPEFGTSYNALIGAQVAKGRASLMVLYQYDFVPGEQALRPAGLRKLQRIAPLLLETPFPVIIEPSRSDPELDEARRLHVEFELAELPFPVLQQRVVVAPPLSRGLDGIDAELIELRLLRLMEGVGMVPAIQPFGTPSQ